MADTVAAVSEPEAVAASAGAVSGSVPRARAFGVTARVGLVVFAVLLAAGFANPVVDEVLMRVADALLSFPALILAIGVVSVLGPSMVHSMLAVGVISSPAIARLLPAAVLPVRDAQFVLVAGSLRVSRVRIRRGGRTWLTRT